MKNRCSQDLIGKLAVSGIIISLFSIAVFIPEINSTSTGIISQNILSYAQNGRTLLPVFNSGVECIYPTDPGNGNISKMPDSSRNVIPFFSASSGFHADNLHPVKYSLFSNKVPHISFRQICLLLDLPPPSFQRLACQAFVI